MSNIGHRNLRRLFSAAALGMLMTAGVLGGAAEANALEHPGTVMSGMLKVRPTVSELNDMARPTIVMSRNFGPRLSFPKPPRSPLTRPRFGW